MTDETKAATAYGPEVINPFEAAKCTQWASDAARLREQALRLFERANAAADREAAGLNREARLCLESADALDLKAAGAKVRACGEFEAA